MRLDFLRELIGQQPEHAPGQLVDQWTHDNSSAIRQFHSMIERAQTHSPIAAAVLAQIASQARNLLEN
jgi:glutamate dehydrogenase